MIDRKLQQIEYREFGYMNGTKYVICEYPVYAHNGLQISSLELSLLHANLSGVGYHVLFAHPPYMMGKAKLPLYGTVVDIDDDYVYIDGDDGESYNIPQECFHNLYAVESIRQESE